MTRPADQSFGGLLRAFRLRARLTQERLAELAGVSVRSIRNFESGRITAPRESTRIALADGLELNGDERRSLEQTGNPRHDRDVAEAVTDRCGIPVPLSSFVGRHREIESILQLLTGQRPRLLTLSGVAGIGQSHLAFAVERNSIDVYWVPLATITDLSLVLGAFRSRASKG